MADIGHSVPGVEGPGSARGRACPFSLVLPSLGEGSHDGWGRDGESGQQRFGMHPVGDKPKAQDGPGVRRPDAGLVGMVGRCRKDAF